ncbi:hypothetical protein [Alteromonas sp. CYL-A6]|uniref:hypothetical protein n=1 Tax=Alteromonas nitratireducens TaxID=3390813 RepID=UPI0034BE6043
MRKPVRLRVTYLVIALFSYLTGLMLLPESTSAYGQPLVSYLYLLLLFVLLPTLFILLVVKAGQQKPWKVVIPLSLGAVVARYALPTELAGHFYIVSYLRYPIIALILLIELAIVYHIVAALWKARHLKGDPRVHAIINHGGDEKKQSLALLMASEPASYYYALPHLTRCHPSPLTHIQLLSAKRLHLTAMLSTLVMLTVTLYLILSTFSELIALIVASVIAYSVVSLTASYRISRHFSCYLLNNILVINANFFNTLCVPVSDIAEAEAGLWPRETLADDVVIGRGENANLKLTFKTDVAWLTMLGTFCDKVRNVYLVTDTPDNAASILQALSSQAPSDQPPPELSPVS